VYRVCLISNSITVESQSMLPLTLKTSQMENRFILISDTGQATHPLTASNLSLLEKLIAAEGQRVRLSGLQNILFLLIMCRLGTKTDKRILLIPVLNRGSTHSNQASHLPHAILQVFQSAREQKAPREERGNGFRLTSPSLLCCLESCRRAIAPEGSGHTRML
jgi:hypothetical protein